MLARRFREKMRVPSLDLGEAIMGRRLAMLSLASAVVLAISACGNAEPDTAGDDESSGRPGVSDTTIRVGGLISKANPVGRDYNQAVEGVEAYLDLVNDQGGVFGRQFEILPVRDDQGRASTQIEQAKALIDEDQVFAVLPIVTNTFSSASTFVEAGTPTFGWNINREWQTGPNLFGEKGSALCYGCVDEALAWFMLEALGLQRAAVISYSVPQSKVCADGIVTSLEHFGANVVYRNSALSFGFTDISADVTAIKDSDAQILFTCMDVNGNVKAARELQGTGIVVQSPEGYDPTVPAEFGSAVEGFYFRTYFVPFEAAAAADVTGMNAFLAAMKERDLEPTELRLAGWVNAMLLVRGIKDAGESFTQQRVVDAINAIDDWTAEGVLAPIDWTLLNPDGTRAYPPDGTLDCAAWVRIEAGAFTPVFGQPGKPLVCLPNGTADLRAVSYL